MNDDQSPAGITATALPATIRFHLSLNVGGLEAAVDFFRAFFGCEPAKCRPDYAKFELSDPPLVLSLEPVSASPGGSLNHLGFRMPNSEALVDMQRRLELAGISTRREEGVECCYARQTKFWVHDPDGNLWEVYTLDADLDERGAGELASEKNDLGRTDAPPESIWSHRLGTPFPARLPILDATVDRVLLHGTLNERVSENEQLARLGEALRVLKPNGVVNLHMLTANALVGEDEIRLPGPAAAVSAVPVDAEVLTLLGRAGFLDPRITFRAQQPCFRVRGAELCETRIEATKLA